ncbi:MAG: bifunctional hydroxymethylpyrimidine kinase/phosphomethylpyrimidine kinase [Candidatus Jordarchaeales archaeon]|nr:bifunctional hydroxymethylpyrimidine kinase/phosphomethylpyrimidine kinase [Candidatus Jordarchaeia archaeon]
MVPVALTIAGSDPLGGAGVQMDLKTFASLGVHGVCALTAVTAQNTVHVRDIYVVPPEIIMAQVDVLMEDLEINAAKTGMLRDKETVDVVCTIEDEYGFPLVVDPIIWAGSGERLASPSAEKAIIDQLVPRATVVTPNVAEASLIADMQIKTVRDMEEAAKAIASRGAEVVVVKGGHLDEDKNVVVDVMYAGGETRVFEKMRVREGVSHGRGCCFSAAITAFIAMGEPLPSAVEKAESYVEKVFCYPVDVGRGRKPANPLVLLQQEAEKWRVISDVERAVEMLEAEKNMDALIPEVRMNVGMAASFARGVEDVAAVEGRIAGFRGRARALGCPKFGASSHIARVILKVMEYDPGIRAAINLKYSPDIIEACRKAGFIVAGFDRKEEPEDVRSVEGRSLQWGVEQAIQKAMRVPDVIYDEGGYGKEGMVRVLAQTATEAVEKVLRIKSQLKL